MSELSEEITTLLAAHAEGSEAALASLCSLLYADLRRLARGQLRRRRPGESLETTGLVHEAYLRLAGRDGGTYRDRSHFFAVAARAMRQAVIDHARRRSRLKRGGGQQDEPLDEEVVAGDEEVGRFLELDQALDRLESVEPRLVKVVECRFFAGLSERETAEALAVTERTVQRDWRKAKAWLRELMAR